MTHAGAGAIRNIKNVMVNKNEKVFTGFVLVVYRSGLIIQKNMEWVGGPDSLDILLKQSDYVVLCLPLNSDSQGLINEDAFKKMKKGSFLINVSRGGLVDYRALKTALKEKNIAGAGLDVFWEEPPDPTDDIFKYNIMATPHIGGATDISMQGIAASVAENIDRIARGKVPINQAFGSES